jgi:hypothetical protein
MVYREDRRRSKIKWKKILSKLKPEIIVLAIVIIGLAFYVIVLINRPPQRAPVDQEKIDVDDP